MKIKFARLLQTRVVNRSIQARAGSPGYRYAMLETLGCKSHVRRQTPVAYGIDGETIWVISIFGPDAYYVRNLKADPHVRIKIDGTWHSGIAHPVPGDDPQQRLKLFNPQSATQIRRYGAGTMSVRIDLEPAAVSA